jgi:OHCU decarboxylase
MPDAQVATTSAREVEPSGVAALNGLPPGDAHAALRGCCASGAWVTAMERGRHFASAEAVLGQAEAAFDALGPEDWLAAFAAHARIGAPRPDDARGAAEQAGTASASAEVLAELQTGNDRYEARFGHVFLIRASGLDAGQMLAALRERLENPPAQEREIAAAQQREITRLRLRALLAS